MAKTICIGRIKRHSRIQKQTQERVEKRTSRQLSEQRNLALVQTFVRRLLADKVTSPEAWKAWKKADGNEKFMEKCFRYKRKTKGMPSVTSLINICFHKQRPLMNLNYSQSAGGTLYKFANGWTGPLGLCRGLVFEMEEGRLVAKGFPKFFNHNEPSSIALCKQMRRRKLTISAKKDGHLGIIFEHEGQFIVTTRGKFDSPSAIRGNEILQGYLARQDWKAQYPSNTTVLVEMIDKSMKHLTDYGDQSEFVIIGAYNNETLYDYTYEELVELGKWLGMALTEVWEGTLDELEAEIANTSVTNAEGYVARDSSGNRVKFKYVRHIGDMFKKKLNYRGIMQWIAKGDYDVRLSFMDEEAHAVADSMLAHLKAVRQIAPTGNRLETLRTRRNYIFWLANVSEQNITSDFSTVANKYINLVCQD